MEHDKNLEVLIDNYIKGNCSPEELKKLLKIFEEPYHNLALRPTLFNQWIKQDSAKSIKFEEKEQLLLLNKIHQTINQSPEKKPQHKRVTKIIEIYSKVAAILVVGILIGVLIQKFVYTRPISLTSIAPKGSISQIILPDNSVAFLNSDSKITYSINNHSGIREVFLEGEAWFEIKENEEKPLIVHTPFYSIKVLGTQFNVKAYESDDEIVTTLEEGSIEVLSDNKIKVSHGMQLEPGQQFIYNRTTNAVRTATVRTRLFTSWKENRLIFINMNLKELIVLLERKYGVEIEVSDNIILDYHYDGTIKNESILEVLELLKETLPIRYKIEGQNIIIQKSKEK